MPMYRVTGPYHMSSDFSLDNHIVDCLIFVFSFEEFCGFLLQSGEVCRGCQVTWQTC